MLLGDTYTGATEVAGPGSVGSVGNATVAHCSKKGKGRSAHVARHCELASRDQGSPDWTRTYGLLDVIVREAGGKVSVARGRGRHGDDFAAVDELALVLAEERHLLEDLLEAVLELGLVVHERLPLASSARVAGKLAVGLEAQLAVERGLDLALVAARAWEYSAAELSLDKELSVEEPRGGIEGRSGDGRVDKVGGSDCVRTEQPDDFNGGKPGIGEAGKDRVHSVCPCWLVKIHLSYISEDYRMAPGRSHQERVE